MNESIEVEHKGIVYRQIFPVVINSIFGPQVFERVAADLQNEQCVRNACLTAPLISAVCVEGFVSCMILIDSFIHTRVLRHCWNKVGDVHVDITKDYVWSKLGVAQEEDFMYFPVAEYQYTDYNFNRANLFNSNVVEIAAEIEAKLNQG